MTEPRIPRDFLADLGSQEPHGSPIGAPDNISPAQSSGPKVVVSIRVNEFDPVVVEGVACLAIVGLTNKDVGLANHTLASSSPLQAASMLAMAIATVRKDYGDVAVRQALEIEARGRRDIPNGTPIVPPPGSPGQPPADGA